MFSSQEFKSDNGVEYIINSSMIVAVFVIILPMVASVIGFTVAQGFLVGLALSAVTIVTAIVIFRKRHKGL